MNYYKFTNEYINYIFIGFGLNLLFLCTVSLVNLIYSGIKESLYKNQNKNRNKRDDYIIIDWENSYKWKI
jgi:hypothetical protein